MSTNQTNMTTSVAAPKSAEQEKTPDYGAWPTDEEVAAAETGTGADAAATKSSIDDRFSLARLRTEIDYSAAVGLRDVITEVPVRKPSREWFVRVKPGPDERFQTMVLQLKEEGEIYLVDPDLWGELADELVPMLFVTAINRQGVVFLWPVRMADPTGRMNSWSLSALRAISVAEGQWVRLTADRSLGGYRVSVATADLPKPTWPEVTLDDLIRIAFEHKRIDQMSHPVVKALRGEA